MSLVYNIKRTKLEPETIRKVGDEDLFEDDDGNVSLFKIKGLLSSDGLVSECKNSDIVHVWSSNVPYISNWNAYFDSSDTPIDVSKNPELDNVLNALIATMPNPTEEQLNDLKKLEFNIGYIDGKWKRITDLDEFVEYHPECIQQDGIFTFNH